MSGTIPACEDLPLLIQADLDGELDAAAAAMLAAHLRDCPGCAALQRGLSALSVRLRTEIPPEAAPDRLRRTIMAHLPAAAPPRQDRVRRRLAPLLSFGAGAAIAASLLLLVVAPVDQSGLDAQLLASHVRALQPGHLTDVQSTDQHTVKPWFDGRIDYAPPVRDLAQAGFPLIGGRLDYNGRRNVAALIYQRGKHVIDLYVWPGDAAPAAATTTERGYTIVAWTQGGMQFRAVSDLERDQLLHFAQLFQS